MRASRKIYTYFAVMLFTVVLLTGWLIRPANLQTARHHDYQLLVSSLNGDADSVRRLLRSGADPSTPPGPQDKGMSALMFAAWRGNEEITRMLLDAGADPNTVSANGSSPLIFAAATGNVEVVKLLLRTGANPDYVSENGVSSIMAPLAKRNLEVVRTLVAATRPSVLNGLRVNGTPLLIVAAKSGDFQIVNALPLAGMDLDLRDGDGQTALMHAARTGHTQIVSKLLREGADVNARDSNGTTALSKAIIGNRIAVIQVLRSYDARP